MSVGHLFKLFFRKIESSTKKTKQKKPLSQTMTSSYLIREFGVQFLGCEEEANEVGYFSCELKETKKREF